MDLIDLYLLLKLWTCVNHICSTDLCLLPIAGVTATSIQLLHCSVRLFDVSLSSSLVFGCQKQHTSPGWTNNNQNKYVNEMQILWKRNEEYLQSQAISPTAILVCNNDDEINWKTAKGIRLKWKHFDVHEHFPFDLFRFTIINLTNVIFYHFLWALTFTQQPTQHHPFSRLHIHRTKKRRNVLYATSHCTKFVQRLQRTNRMNEMETREKKMKKIFIAPAVWCHCYLLRTRAIVATT